jgi:pimeloyl-ACP methyl ester carboxylesterase
VRDILSLDPAVADRPAQSARGAEVENHIRMAFAACFKIADVGLDDDFFALGGDSLRAAKMLERIAKTLHVRLEPDVFFTAPTPRLLAEAVATCRADDRPAASPSLVQLRAGGGGTPVYFVHGITPRPWMFQRFLPALGLSRPVYGTSSPDLHWERDVLTIDEMALHYATEIKRLQRRGPYSLVGFSFGGSLAFAIAERLMRDGHAVSHLVLLDTTAPGLMKWWSHGSKILALTIVLRWLARRGVLSHEFLSRLELKTPVGALTNPVGLVKFGFGSGPVTEDELRRVLRIAFPGYPHHRTKAMSFDALCAAIATELQRVLSDDQWMKIVVRAGSEAPAHLVKGIKLAAKNVLLAYEYRPRFLYEGQITIYAAAGNCLVDGWQRYTTRPLRIKRFGIEGTTWRIQHKAFIQSHNIALYGEDLGRFLESDGDTSDS